MCFSSLEGMSGQQQKVCRGFGGRDVQNLTRRPCPCAISSKGIVNLLVNQAEAYVKKKPFCQLSALDAQYASFMEIITYRMAFLAFSNVSTCIVNSSYKASLFFLMGGAAGKG